MAAEGEERLLTMYADVHYYFTEPSPRPASHRMDKGSYLYLYRTATQGQGRLEIANYAGTDNQDAFTGYLDNSKVANKFKHPTLVTIVVDGARSGHAQPQESEHHWRLPSTDPRDEGKYLFKLHTLDIYFWTAEDATTFLTHTQQTLRPEQLEVEMPPPPARRSEMSPVVQQLENVAISDPAYRNGQTRNSQPTSEASKQLQVEQKPAEEAKDATNYTPLAYNPAAPAAPEKRTHREKTPPPADAHGDTGLVAAVHSDHQPAQSPSPYTPGAPSPYNPSPFSGASVSSPPPPPTSAGSPHSGYVPTPGDPNAHLYAPSAASSTAAATSPGPPSSSTAAPSGHVDSPTTQILGGSYIGGHAVPLQHVQPQYADYLASRPQPPPGGYSNFSYTTPQAQHGLQHAPMSNTGDHALHSQVYRPTEEEHFTPPKHAATTGPAGQGPGRYDLEGKAERAEKKFNKFLRKVEKKMG